MEHDQLDALDRAFAECAAECESLAASVPKERLAQRPGRKKWSAAECIEHLNITGQVFYLRLRREIDALRVESAPGGEPYSMEFVAKLLAWYLEPPARMKSATGESFEPVHSPNPDRVFPSFISLQAKLRELVNDSRGYAIDQRKITSPFASRVRYNLYSALCLVAAHQRRHLWQAKRALERVGR